MRPRTLQSYGLGGLLVIGLALAVGCLNPRPEDFPSAELLPGGEVSTDSPGNSLDPGTSQGGGGFNDDFTPAPVPVSPPTAPTQGEGGGDADAGAPPSDGGAAAALAATADGGAAGSESADGCDPAPGPR